MKYVIVEAIVGIIPTEIPIVFSDLLDHAAAAGKHKPLSAGFVSVDYHAQAAYPYGKSTTLKLAPREEDAVILTRLFFP